MPDLLTTPSLISGSFLTEQNKGLHATPVNKAFLNVDRFVASNWTTNGIVSHAAIVTTGLTFGGASRTSKGFLFDYQSANIPARTTDPNWNVINEGGTGSVSFGNLSMTISSKAATLGVNVFESIAKATTIVPAVGQVYIWACTIPLDNPATSYSSIFRMADSSAANPSNLIDVVATFGATGMSWAINTTAGGVAQPVQTLLTNPGSNAGISIDFFVMIEILTMSGSQITGIKVTVGHRPGNPGLAGNQILFNGTLTGTAPTFNNAFMWNRVGNTDNVNNRTVTFWANQIVKSKNLTFKSLASGQVLVLNPNQNVNGLATIPYTFTSTGADIVIDLSTVDAAINYLMRLLTSPYTIGPQSPVQWQWTIKDTDGVTVLGTSAFYPDWHGGDIWTNANLTGTDVFYFGAGNLPMWTSNPFRSQINCIPKLTWFLDQIGASTITFQIRYAQTIDALLTATYQTYSLNGLFNVLNSIPFTLRGYFFQIRINGTVTNSTVSPAIPTITLLRLDTFWEAKRDPLQFTTLKKIGDISREIERDFTAVVTQAVSIEMSNEKGFWNEKGCVLNQIPNNVIDRPISKMYRLTTDTPALPGKYLLTFSTINPFDPQQWTTRASQSFTGATGVLTNDDQGNPWIVQNPGDWQVVVNGATNSLAETVGAFAYCVVESNFSDSLDESFTLTTTGAGAQIVFRFVDSNNYNFIEWNGASYVLQTKNAGVFNARTSVLGTSSNGDVWRIRLNGSYISFYVNNVLIISITLSDNLTGTKHGFGSDFTFTPRYNNFNVTTFATSTANVVATYLDGTTKSYTVIFVDDGLEIVNLIEGQRIVLSTNISTTDQAIVLLGIFFVWNAWTQVSWYDSFTRTSSTTLNGADSGQTYTALSGTWGTDGTQAKEVTYSGGTNDDLAVADGGVANAQVWCTNSQRDTQQRIVFRCTDAFNYWIINDESTNYKVYKKVAGTLSTGFVLVATIATLPVAGNRFRIDLNGNRIDIWINETWVVTIFDSFNMTATKHGFGWGGGGTPTNPRWDNFSIAPYPVYNSYSIYNKEIRLYQGFAYPTTSLPSAQTFEMVPSFTGFINNDQAADTGAIATLMLSDFTKKAQKITLEKLTTDGSDGRSSSNWFIADPMSTMIGRILTYVGYDQNPTDGTKPFVDIDSTIVPTFDGSSVFSVIGKPFQTNQIRALAFDTTTNTYYAGLNNTLLKSTDLSNWFKVLTTTTTIQSMFLNTTTHLLFLFTGQGDRSIQFCEVWDFVSSGTTQFNNLSSVGLSFNPVFNPQQWDGGSNFFLVANNDSAGRLLKIVLNSTGIASFNLTPSLLTTFVDQLNTPVFQLASFKNILIASDGTFVYFTIYTIDPTTATDACGTHTGGSWYAGKLNIATNAVTYITGNSSTTTQSGTAVGLYWNSSTSRLIVIVGVNSCNGTTLVLTRTALALDPTVVTNGNAAYVRPTTLDPYEFSLFSNTHAYNNNYIDGTILKDGSSLGLPVTGDAFQNSNFIFVPANSGNPDRLLAVSGFTTNVLWEFATEIFIDAISDPVTNKANFGNDSALSDLKAFAEAAGFIQYFDESGVFKFKKRPTALTPIDFALDESDEIKITTLDGDSIAYPLINQENVTPQGGTAISFSDSSTSSQVIQYGRQTDSKTNKWIYSTALANAIAKFYVTNFDLPKTIVMSDGRFLPLVSLTKRMTLDKPFLGLFSDSVFLVYKTMNKSDPLWGTMFTLRRLVSSMGNV